jgi:hypothetical protein
MSRQGEDSWVRLDQRPSVSGQPNRSILREHGDVTQANCAAPLFAWNPIRKQPVQEKTDFVGKNPSTNTQFTFGQTSSVDRDGKLIVGALDQRTGKQFWTMLSKADRIKAREVI